MMDGNSVYMQFDILGDHHNLYIQFDILGDCHNLYIQLDILGECQCPAGNTATTTMMYWQQQ